MTEPNVPRFSAEQIRRRRALALRVSVTVIVAVGLLFVVVFPVRAWLDQRSSIQDSEQRLELLRSERTRLDGEARRLDDPTEIERIARQRFNMVKPGEQSWAAVPGTTTTTAPALPSAP